MRRMKTKTLTIVGALSLGALFLGCGRGLGSSDPAAAATSEPASSLGAPSDGSSPGATPKTPRGSDVGIKDVASQVWYRRSLGEMPASWHSRDGAQMVQLATGRILMIGGWSPYDPWGPNYVPNEGGGDRLTNEVWASDDLGVTWSLLLPHDPNPPTSGPGARFLPGHTVGVVTYDGHGVVIGSDGSVERDLLGDVWHESDNGKTWTRVSTNAPTLNRALYMCGNYKGAIYVMGGQESEQDPATAFNDVYRSQDGGITWTRLANAPWSPRGMIYRPVEHAGKLYVVGGGNYADVPAVPIGYNGVYAFDGTSWETILPEGHSQFGTAFYQPLISLDGRLWLFNGYDPKKDVELSRALVSDDNGHTWKSFAEGSGGDGSHADSLVVAGGRILRISGNLSERTVWEFARTQ